MPKVSAKMKSYAKSRYRLHKMISKSSSSAVLMHEPVQLQKTLKEEFFAECEITFKLMFGFAGGRRFHFFDPNGME